MNNNIKLILISILFSGVFAQNLPETYQFGGPRLMKSTINNPEGNSTTDIALTKDVIWVLTNKGLSKTTDNGLNWTNYPDEDFNENESAYFMDYKNGMLWVSFGHKEDGVNFGAGFYYTQDEGANWTHIPQPVDSDIDTTFVYGNNVLKYFPRTIAAEAPTWDIEITDNNTIWAAMFGAGLRKSSDMGQTWQKVLLPPDNLDFISPENNYDFIFDARKHINQRVFSVEAIGNDTIFVGTPGGINISFDGGSSWRKVNSKNTTKGLIGDWVTDIVYNPADKSVWAACRIGEGTGQNYGIAYSFDFGETWTNVLHGYQGNYLGFSKTDILVPTKEDGLFRSTDQGKTWFEVGKISDSNNEIDLNTMSYNVASSIKKDDGSYDIWVGSIAGLAMINEVAEPWEGNWKIFLESGSPGEGKNETYAFPNPFNPKQGVINIKYFLSKESAEVTIRVMDFGMNLVKTVIQNVERNNKGDKIEIWDGKDENGNIVPNGVYFYRVDVGSNDPSFGKILVVR